MVYPNDHVQAYNRPRSSRHDANVGDVCGDADEVRIQQVWVSSWHCICWNHERGKKLLKIRLLQQRDQSMSKIYEISNNNIVAGVDHNGLWNWLPWRLFHPPTGLRLVTLSFLTTMRMPFADERKSKELGMTNNLEQLSGAAISTFQGLYTSYNSSKWCGQPDNRKRSSIRLSFSWKNIQRFLAIPIRLRWPWNKERLMRRLFDTITILTGS